MPEFDPTRYAPRPGRPGEVLLPADPGALPDAGVTFIGQVRSPWGPGDCPKNLREARARGGGGTIEIAEAFRPGLRGLSVGDALVMLYWMAWAERRAIVVQPPHPGARLSGVFATRSPARPNPIALATVRIIALDPVSGRIGIDATDCWDGTPILDLKCHVPGTDIPPELPPEAPAARR